MSKEVVNADFLEEVAGAGYEGLNQGDFLQSFVVILQPLTPQCVKGKDEYMADAEPGMFFNTATGELYGNTLKIIPLHCKHEWLEWKPNRGGFVGRHEADSILVDTSDYAHWRREDNGNEISDTYNLFCVLPDYPDAGIVVMPFTSTNIKPVKSLNTMISMVRTPTGKQAPFFSSVWELGVTKRDDGQNTWYTIGHKKANANRLRYISKEEYTEVVVPMLEAVKTTELDYNKAKTAAIEDKNITDVTEY